MFVKYNLVLRSQSGRLPFLKEQHRKLCKGNLYPTTLHVINTALRSLSPLSSCRTVYRGVRGSHMRVHMHMHMHMHMHIHDSTLLMPNGLPRGERLTQGTHNGTHRNTHRNTQWNTQWNSHAMEPAMHAPSSDLHAASAWSLHGRLLIRAYIVRGTCVVRMWCICICATGGRRLAARVVQHTGRVRLSRRRGCVLIIAYPYYSVPLL